MVEKEIGSIVEKWKNRIRLTRRQILALQIMEPHRMYCTDGIHFAGVLYTWQPSCRQTG